MADEIYMYQEYPSDREDSTFILDNTYDLVQAIRREDKDTVKKMLEEFAAGKEDSLLEIDMGLPEETKLPLVEAIETENMDIIKLLINAGALVDNQGWYYGETPLDAAKDTKDEDIIKFIKRENKKQITQPTWDRRKDLIIFRRNERKKNPSRKLLTKKYGKEEEDVGTTPDASGSGSSTGGKRKHRGKKRKQTKRRKPRKSTRKPKRRVKKRKQTKRRRRR